MLLLKENIIRLIRFGILCSLKSLRYFFYPTSIKWIGPKTDWKDVRLFILLNHTSLFEFVYAGILPFKYLWTMSKHLTFPVADVTYNRKILGKFYRMLAPTVNCLSRKKDDSWSQFLANIKPQSIMIFPPEGRMKRRNGLDKEGKEFRVRGGSSDILPHFLGSKLLLIYSGGLHHVFAPGDKFPRFFKKIHVAIEEVDISKYCEQFMRIDGSLDKILICEDLDHRRDIHCST